MLPGSCPVGIKAGVRQKQCRGLWFIVLGGFPQKASRILFGFAFYYHFWTAGKPCTLVILLTPLCLPGVTCGRYKTPWNHHRMVLCFPSNLRGGCDAVKVQCRSISGRWRQAAHCNTRKLQSRETGIRKSEEVAWSSSWLQFSIYNPGNSLSVNTMSLRTFLGNLLWSTFQSHLWFWSSSLNSTYDLSSHTGTRGPGTALSSNLLDGFYKTGGQQLWAEEKPCTEWLEMGPWWAGRCWMLPALAVAHTPLGAAFPGRPQRRSDSS